MENQQSGKPRSVTLAVTLLWISLAIGAIKTPFNPVILLFTSPGNGWFGNKAADPAP